MTKEEIARLKGHYTCYELALFLSWTDGVVSERDVARWVRGDRAPRGPATALLRLVEQIMRDGQVTRAQVLAKAGYPVVVRSINEIKKEF